MEGHLTFLVECRGAFGGINELKVCINFFFLFFSASSKHGNRVIHEFKNLKYESPLMLMYECDIKVV